jgi:hypothetical protein
VSLGYWLDKRGRHGAAGWREVTCRRKTAAARSASWSLVETLGEAEAPGAGRSLDPRRGHGIRGGAVGD